MCAASFIPSSSTVKWLALSGSSCKLLRELIYPKLRCNFCSYFLFPESNSLYTIILPYYIVQRLDRVIYPQLNYKPLQDP